MTSQARQDAKMIAFSDRLGKRANASNRWFDKMVRAWESPSGQRLVGMELNQIGEQLLVWLATGEKEVTEAVLSEMEEALSDGELEHVDARAFGLEVLDGLLTAVADNRDLHDDRTLEAQLLQLMGDETKLLWIPKLSSLPA